MGDGDAADWLPEYPPREIQGRLSTTKREVPQINRFSPRLRGYERRMWVDGLPVAETVYGYIICNDTCRWGGGPEGERQTYQMSIMTNETFLSTTYLLLEHGSLGPYSCGRAYARTICPHNMYSSIALQLTVTSKSTHIQHVYKQLAYGPEVGGTISRGHSAVCFESVLHISDTKKPSFVCLL